MNGRGGRVEWSGGRGGGACAQGPGTAEDRGDKEPTFLWTVAGLLGLDLENCDQQTTRGRGETGETSESSGSSGS